MLETIGKHTEREHLRRAKSIGRSRSIGHAAWELQDLGDPSAIIFLLELVGERHGWSVAQPTDTMLELAS